MPVNGATEIPAYATSGYRLVEQMLEDLAAANHTALRARIGAIVAHREDSEAMLGVLLALLAAALEEHPDGWRLAWREIAVPDHWKQTGAAK